MPYYCTKVLSKFHYMAPRSLIFPFSFLLFSLPAWMDALGASVPTTGTRDGPAGAGRLPSWETLGVRGCFSPPLGQPTTFGLFSRKGVPTGAVNDTHMQFEAAGMATLPGLPPGGMVVWKPEDYVWRWASHSRRRSAIAVNRLATDGPMDPLASRQLPSAPLQLVFPWPICRDLQATIQPRLFLSQ